jgi:hypothetical protein
VGLLDGTAPVGLLDGTAPVGHLTLNCGAAQTEPGLDDGLEIEQLYVRTAPLSHDPAVL